MNQVIETVESDIEEVVPRVVRHPEKRNPFSNDLVAEIELRDLDLGPFSQQRFRHPIEERSPL
jgi:hypothetical protein